MGIGERGRSLEVELPLDHADSLGQPEGAGGVAEKSDALATRFDQRRGEVRAQEAEREGRRAHPGADIDDARHRLQMRMKLERVHEEDLGELRWLPRG